MFRPAATPLLTNEILNSKEDNGGLGTRTEVKNLTLFRRPNGFTGDSNSLVSSSLKHQRLHCTTSAVFKAPKTALVVQRRKTNAQ